MKSSGDILKKKAIRNINDSMKLMSFASRTITMDKITKRMAMFKTLKRNEAFRKLRENARRLR